MKASAVFQFLIVRRYFVSQLFLISLFTLCVTAISAQEICNNGIDDDGDSLVDINDDECICNNLLPLTNVFGSPCSRIDLEFDHPDIISYQRYWLSLTQGKKLGSVLAHGHPHYHY